MPTLTEIRHRMIERGPADLGRVESVASLTTTTVVVTKLAVGSYDSQYLEGYWMLRPDTATAADRRRVVDSFAVATGTLTHTGTNYGDTTATSELVELWKYDPEMVDMSVQTALMRLRRSYELTLPAIHGARMQFLNRLPITKPADVMRIEASNSRVLTNNRFFDEYWTVNSSGVLQPDFWTIAGTSATMARSTTQTYRSKYALAITRAGTDCTVTQDIGLLTNGVSGEDLKGQTVAALLACWSTEASQIRVGINDGVTTTYSSYHTGGDAWEVLEVSKTLASTATKCELTISVETSNTVCYAGECFLSWEQIQDSDRRLDETRWTFWDRDYKQTTSLPVMLSPRSLGETWKVTVSRSYPLFDKDRISLGTADDDETDAPIETVAYGALGALYERLAGTTNENTSQEKAIAEEKLASFNVMAAQLLALPDIDRGKAPTQKPYMSLAGLRGL